MASPIAAEMERNRTCMLVSSCDSYSDLWPALSMSMTRYWPDCPFPRFLLTNHKEAPNGFLTLAVGPDVSWSANLVRALHKLDTDYVLLSVDDLLLNKTVRTNAVLDAVRWASIHGVAALQMVSYEYLWGGAWSLGSIEAIRLPLGATYRASAVFTLWNRDRLVRLLDPTETAWQFEYRGSERLLSDSSVYLTTRKYFSFVNCVVKGKLTRFAVGFCNENGYPLLASRQVMARREEWRLLLLRLRFCAFRLVPLGYRAPLKKEVQRVVSVIRRLLMRQDVEVSKGG